MRGKDDCKTGAARYCQIRGPGIRHVGNAAAARGQDASKTKANGKAAKNIIKYVGRVSARLQKQPLREAKMRAKQNLLARMQKVLENTRAGYP